MRRKGGRRDDKDFESERKRKRSDQGAAEGRKGNLDGREGLAFQLQPQKNGQKHQCSEGITQNQEKGEKSLKKSEEEMGDRTF